MHEDESNWDTSTLIDYPTASSRTASFDGHGKIKDDHVQVTSQHERAMTKPNPSQRIAFMAGRDDFRAARLRCTHACSEYNKMTEDAPTEDRVSKWLNIVDPDNQMESNTSSAVAFSDAFSKPKTQAASDAPAARPRPTFPYVKMPVYMDYGLRVKIGPTTFINRNCFILDTPVADVVIGDRCQFGPNVTIISVGHSVKQEERNELETGIAGSWGAKIEIGDGVWVGAGTTILPGVTIGECSTIGAGSVVTRDIPPRCVAVGNPAKILYFIPPDSPPVQYAQTAMTLQEALRIGREDK